MSLTNKIIANIKNTNSNQFNYINSNNVICIDSSNNRLGINTRDPNYSIHISDGTIKTNNLIIDNSIIALTGDAYIYNISANFIRSNDMSLTNLDISNYAKFNTISGNHININTISGNILDFSYIFTSDICGSDISCNNLFINNNLEVLNKIDTSYVVAQTIDSSNLNTDNFVLSLLKTNKINVTVGNNYQGIINSENIDCSDLIVNVHARIKKLTVTGDASFNGLVDISSLTVSGESNFKDKVIMDASLQVKGDISTSTLYINSIKDNSGNPILTDGKIGGNIGGEFNFLDVSTIVINSKLLSQNAIIDLSKGNLILPDSSNNSNLNNSIFYDQSINRLKIYNNDIEPFYKEKLFENNFATIKLNTNTNEISGNDVSFNYLGNNNLYFIENSNNLIIENNCKYIPLTFDLSYGNKFFINNPSYKDIEINNNKNDDIYEINANVCIKYLNKIPGDVEPNNYNFGLYSNNTSYININNSILVIDNSYNYSVSSLNYIGKCISDTSGFRFLIKSNKDINYIVIDSFNCTIKQLL